MYSYKVGLRPNVFKETFLMTNQVHSYNTRNSNTFYFALLCTNSIAFFCLPLAISGAPNVSFRKISVRETI